MEEAKLVPGTYYRSNDKSFARRRVGKAKGTCLIEELKCSAEFLPTLLSLEGKDDATMDKLLVNPIVMSLIDWKWRCMVHYWRIEFFWFFLFLLAWLTWAIRRVSQEVFEEAILQEKLDVGFISVGLPFLTLLLGAPLFLLEFCQTTRAARR